MVAAPGSWPKAKPMRAHTDPLLAGVDSTTAVTEGASRVGLVGPNAIIQTVAALREIEGRQTCSSILQGAGLGDYLVVAPSEMVSEREVARLFDALCRTLPPDASAAVLGAAGRNTADYILAHRIPMLAQRLIGLMPPVLGARVLMAAISKHAWTFAGSGTVTCDLWQNLSIGIACNSLATPGCPWHVAVFARLFEVLVSPSARIDHLSCCARGVPVCLTRVDLA